MPPEYGKLHPPTSQQSTADEGLGKLQLPASNTVTCHHAYPNYIDCICCNAVIRPGLPRVCRPEGVDLYLSRCSKLRNGVELGPPIPHWMMINLYTSTSGVKIWQPYCFYLEDLGSFSSILWIFCSPHDRNTTPSGRCYVWPDDRMLWSMVHYHGNKLSRRKSYTKAARALHLSAILCRQIHRRM